MPVNTHKNIFSCLVFVVCLFVCLFSWGATIRVLGEKNLRKSLKEGPLLEEIWFTGSICNPGGEN